MPCLLRLKPNLLEENGIVHTLSEEGGKSHNKDELDQLKDLLHHDTKEPMLLMVVVDSGEEGIKVFNMVPSH
jgi:hypothetical protein